MDQDQIKQVFDQMAVRYDKQWLKMSSINQCLYLLLESVFAELPVDSRILCVGVGTGKELIYLAKRFPSWNFTAVEPSKEMLNLCQKSIESEGLLSRCVFHEGYLDSLPFSDSYDGATCFLVSHFILQVQARIDFFQGIANKLKPHGVLASSDLSFDVESECYDSLLGVWHKVLAPSGVFSGALEKMKETYAKDAAILPPNKVASIIQSAGFERPTPFFQAGLIHGFFAKRAPI